MDLTRILEVFGKGNKTPEELKELDLILQNIFESGSGYYNLPLYHRYAVIRKLQICVFQDSAIVFNKGDHSDGLYIILHGMLQMFNISPNGFRIFEKAITQGSIGERGIIKNKPRSLTVVSSGTTYLLKLDAFTFKKYLSTQFAAGNLEKRLIVDKHIPCISQFTEPQKERIAYSIKIETFFKGKVLLRKACHADFMRIILEGECAMISEQGNIKKIVALLETGSIIGEDTVFLERNSLYDVVVLTDVLKVASIKTSETRMLFPNAVIATMRELIMQRNLARSKLANYSNPCLSSKPNTTLKNIGYLPSLRNIGYLSITLTPRERLSDSSRDKKMLQDLSLHTIFRKNMT